MPETNTTPPREVITNRLSRTAYDALEKEVQVIGHVGKTDIEAGFLNGVEFVLRKLRKGYVISDGE
jgi:hypothetical protein